MRSWDTIVGCVAGVAMLGIVLYVWQDADQHREAEAETRRAAAAKLQASLQSLVARTGAVTNWCDEELRDNRLFSVALEQRWTGSSPILFSGQVVNIAGLSADDYQVTLSHSDRWLPYESRCRLRTGPIEEVRLSLACPRPIVDELLSTNPAVASAYNAEVAVAAQIKRIVHEVKARDMLVGEGRCEDLLFLGR